MRSYPDNLSTSFPSNDSLMKFHEFPYERPVIESFTEEFSQVLDEFAKAETFDTQKAAFQQIAKMRLEFDSMNNLCRIRHSLNYPQFQALNTKFYGLLADARFRKELEEEFGSQLFTIAELTLKTFKPELLDGLRNENCLKSEYTKLRASARINFNGAEYNLSSILPLEISQDRNTRKAAANAKWQFYVDNADEIAASCIAVTIWQ